VHVVELLELNAHISRKIWPSALTQFSEDTLIPIVEPNTVTVPRSTLNLAGNWPAALSCRVMCNICLISVAPAGLPRKLLTLDSEAEAEASHVLIDRGPTIRRLRCVYGGGTTQNSWIPSPPLLPRSIVEWRAGKKGWQTRWESAQCCEVCRQTLSDS
jgi:hypothetical protein